MKVIVIGTKENTFQWFSCIVVTDSNISIEQTNRLREKCEQSNNLNSKST